MLLCRIASTQAPESSSSWGGEKTTVFWKSTLLILAVEQAAEVNKLLVGNVFIVNAHSLPLTTEEVGGVDGASTAAIHCIKTLPAATDMIILKLQSVGVRVNVRA